MSGHKLSGKLRSYYVISTNHDIFENNKFVIGRVNSNLMRTEYIIYDNGIKSKYSTSSEEIRQFIGEVQYESSLFGSQGFRRMKIYLPEIDANSMTPIEVINDKGSKLHSMYKQGENKHKIKYITSKDPIYDKSKIILHFKN
jgi:hypothetical protein